MYSQNIVGYGSPSASRLRGLAASAQRRSPDCPRLPATAFVLGRGVHGRAAGRMPCLRRVFNTQVVASGSQLSADPSFAPSDASGDSVGDLGISVVTVGYPLPVIPVPGIWDVPPGGSAGGPVRPAATSWGTSRGRTPAGFLTDRGAATPGTVASIGPVPQDCRCPRRCLPAPLRLAWAGLDTG